MTNMVDQESEKEYIEEFKSRCVDGKVSDREVSDKLCRRAPY
jgi:hypothetical protein